MGSKRKRTKPIVDERSVVVLASYIGLVRLMRGAAADGNCVAAERLPRFCKLAHTLLDLMLAGEELSDRLLDAYVDEYGGPSVH